MIPPELLTIILTTSPVPSSPSPELVESVLASLSPELALVPLIISFDGYTLSGDAGRANGRLKKGQIPRELADTYPAYYENVKALFDPRRLTESEEEEGQGPGTARTRTTTFLDGATGRRVTLLRQGQRQGFGFSVKAALPLVATAHVLVLQHDWVFDGPGPPWAALLDILAREPEVGYVTFIARQSRRYECSRSGTHRRFPAVFAAARALRAGRPLADALVSCHHWFDRPHLASSALYREIFRGDAVRRGDFLEDTLGTAYLSAIAGGRTDGEAVAAWRSLGAWIHHPGDGDRVAIRHTSGRTVLAKPLQEARIREYVRASRERGASAM